MLLHCITEPPESVERSNKFRNEILQAEGNLNALWHCVQAYIRATSAWGAAASALADEYKKVSDTSLFHSPATVAGAGAGAAPADDESGNRGSAYLRKKINRLLVRSHCECSTLQKQRWR